MLKEGGIRRPILVAKIEKPMSDNRRDRLGFQVEFADGGDLGVRKI